MKIFIINGYPYSGKDTFVDYCIEEIQKTSSLRAKKISSVDKVKDAAILLGWDEKKDDIGRKFLSDLKDLSTKVWNGPFNYIKNHIWYGGQDILFVFIREPAEIDAVVESFGAIPVFIQRLNQNNIIQKNHADARVESYIYPITIPNNSSLSDLKKAAKLFVRDHCLEKKSFFDWCIKSLTLGDVA